MSSSESDHLIEALRATLRHLESSTEWSQEDRAVIELKRILERRIREEAGASQDQDIV